MEHCETAGICELDSYMETGELRTTLQPPPPDLAFATIVSDPVKMVLFRIANLEKLPDDKVTRSLIHDFVVGGEDGSAKFSFGVSFPGDISHSRFAFLPVYISETKDSVATFRILGKPIYDTFNNTD